MAQAENGRSLPAFSAIRTDHSRNHQHGPDPSTTGDPAFNSPWSYTHLPTVSFPIGLADDGLPVALQLVGPRCMDSGLLRVAQWCEQAIRTSTSMKGSSHGRPRAQRNPRPA